MTKPIQTFVHDSLSTTNTGKQTFLRDSEAKASELLENLEEITTRTVISLADSSPQQHNSVLPVS